MCPLHLLWLLRLQLLLLLLLLQLALLMITMMRLSTKFRPETGGGCRGCSVCASCHAWCLSHIPHSTERLASTIDRPMRFRRRCRGTILSSQIVSVRNSSGALSTLVPWLATTCDVKMWGISNGNVILGVWETRCARPLHFCVAQEKGWYCVGQSWLERWVGSHPGMR